MKGAISTPDPSCVSECPNVRMSECPNVRRIPSAWTDRRAAPSMPHSPTAIRDPVDAVRAADADGRRRTRSSRRCATRTQRDDATTRIRTRDDEDARARARTLTGRREARGARRSERRDGARARAAEEPRAVGEDRAHGRVRVRVRVHDEDGDESARGMGMDAADARGERARGDGERLMIVVVVKRMGLCARRWRAVIDARGLTRAKMNERTNE